MPGNAILGSNLVDGLLGTVDDLRDSLHTEFGVRQFRVYTVQRTYTSGVIGDGDYVDVVNELTPQPLVESWLRNMSGLGQNLEPCGIEESGFVTLREISLTYTEDELTGGGALAAGVDWFIRIDDGHGQDIMSRRFQVNRPPFPDRIKDIGWTMELIRMSDEES